MKIRNTVILVAAILLPVLCTNARAANMADPTFFHRKAPFPNIKAIYDDGPWGISFYGAHAKTTAYYLHWESKGGVKQKELLILSYALTKSIDVGAAGELWKNGRWPTRGEVSIDWHTRQQGVGLILPLRADDNVKLGLRQALNPNTTAYLTLTERTTPLFGISISQSGWRFEPAYSSQVWYVYTSKQCGWIVSELRLKFTPKENFIGAGALFRLR